MKAITLLLVALLLFPTVLPASRPASGKAVSGLELAPGLDPSPLHSPPPAGGSAVSPPSSVRFPLLPLNVGDGPLSPPPSPKKWEREGEGGRVRASSSSPVPLDPVAGWYSADSDRTMSIAWGDMDGDGDLDLAAGNYGTPNKVYLNVRGMLQPTAAWQSADGEGDDSVAWGDMDGDGDLDLATGKICWGDPTCHSSKVYLNVGGMLQPTAVWQSAGNDGTSGIAWGDVDGDGDLDLAAGNPCYYDPTCHSSKLYLNVGGILLPTADWQSADSDYTNSIAWGDMDGDGDLDLAVGNYGAPSKVYLNVGGMLQPTAAWQSADSDPTRSVTWGDVDGDGDLDLAAGCSDCPNRVYLNMGGMLAPTAAWQSADGEGASSVAWGDVDGDGDLDLAAGNSGAPSKVYLNVGGMLQPTAAWQSADGDPTRSAAWGDVDGDGDLDLAAGNDGDYNKIYLNVGGMFSPTPTWQSADSDRTNSIAWGDVDGDGDLDLAAGNPCYYDPTCHSSKLYLNVGGILLPTADWQSADWDGTTSVAWGDMDGDGDLDLAAGNSGQPNKVYLNVNGTLQPTAVWQSAGNDGTSGIAWGDMDGDGDLDLAVGTGYGQPNKVYLNVGGVLSPTASWQSADDDETDSVAWGDIDGDGDLDLAVGNFGNGAPSKVYLNVGGMLQPTAAWQSADSDRTRSVAWGDMDGDGDLDLAAGCINCRNKVYLNEGGMLQPTAAWQSADSENVATSVAWGDVNGDGDLDLAVGNSNGPNKVYLNVGGMLQPTAAWQSADSGNTWSVALGDVDGDGDLDLAAGIANGSNRVYLNLRPADPANPGRPPAAAAVTPALAPAAGYGTAQVRGPTPISITYTLLDPEGRPMSVRARYSADGGGRWLSAAPTSDTLTATLTTNVTLAGTGPQHAISDTGALCSPLNLHAPLQPAQDLELGLTIRHTQDSQLAAALYAPWPAPTGTAVLLFSGVGGDSPGFDDLVLNDQATVPITAVTTYTGLVGYWKLDEGSGITATDSSGNGHYGTLVNGPAYTTTVPPTTTFPNPYALSFDGVDDYVEISDEAAFRLPQFSVAGWIQVVTFTQPNQPIISKVTWSLRRYSDTNVLSFYDSGQDLIGVTDVADGRWHHVAAVFDGVTKFLYVDGQLEGSAMGPIYALDYLLWIGGDSFDQLYFPGLLDDVRIYGRGLTAAEVAQLASGAEALPIAGRYRPIEPLARLDGMPLDITFTLVVTDSVPGGVGTLEKWSLRTAPSIHHTYTWDVLGSGFFGRSDNVVFRLEALPDLRPIPNGAAGPYQRPYVSATTYPFRVRGSQVRVLSGTLPISDAAVYRLPEGQSRGARPYADLVGVPYRTDGSGYLQGRGELYVGDRLVTLLPISATEAYTLYLTSAAVTLTGVIPYTVTAPGVQTLTVSPDNPLLLLNLDVSLEWDARQDQLFLDQLAYDLQRASEFLYDWTNGQAALGRVTVYHDREHWADADVRIYASNRLHPSAAQGGIVPQIISDTLVPTITYAPGQIYLGPTWTRYGDPGGSLGEDWPRVLAHELGHYALFLDDNYLGLDAAGRLVPVAGCPGAMSDPYRQDWPYDEFHLAAGWLPECANTLSQQLTGRADWTTLLTFYPALAAGANPGPAGLPLALPQVRFVAPVTPTTTLPDPFFNLTQDGHSVQPGRGARALLYQADRVVDLGRPVLDAVLARGAREGDRLCVYEPEAERLGCETLTSLDRELALVATDPPWPPEIVVAPVTSRTLVLTVTGAPAGRPLVARLYPAEDPATAPITLTEQGGAYYGTFSLTQPAYAGYVQLWVEEAEPRREAVIDYALGGHPGHVKSRFGHVKSRFAPAISNDGQVILFGRTLDFQTEQYLALQAVTMLPSPPAWATPVGRGYRLLTSPGGPDLAGTSLSFSYLGNEVPTGEEPWLRVYYWDGAAWTILTTTVNADYNLASAPVEGEGVYALMSSIEIPLAQGWNNAPYPVQEARPVTETLFSISGTYGIVYHYNASNPADHWQVYGADAPAWVNALDSFQFEFGQSYWISTTAAITLYLKGGWGEGLGERAGFPYPPATYYGEVQAGAGFTPTAGMSVTAWVSGNRCGQGWTREEGGQVVYVVDVWSALEVAGCGLPGQAVAFRVEARDMLPTAVWDNNRLWEVPLGVGRQYYLPLVVR